MYDMTQPSLFDIPQVSSPPVAIIAPPIKEPKVDVNQPLANKIDSFYSKDTQGKRLTQKERVLIAIQLQQPCSDAMISIFTGIDRHLIPDRRKLLKDEIEVSHSKLDKKN